MQSSSPPTLAELHERFTWGDDPSVPAPRIAIGLVRAAFASGDDEQLTLALELLVAIDKEERAWWQMGNPGQPIATWSRTVLHAVREDWRRAAEAVRDAAQPELREAARASLELLAPTT
ncbi:MAG TPA: hypothetical protein VLB44_06980 [Kofleriaceae bacterium]|nr:hypothetical protein [Kofleriaceae bacterium]